MGLHVLSPDSSVPPPPSPPCTCGKVLGDMGPPPPPDPWDSQSIDSRRDIHTHIFHNILPLHIYFLFSLLPLRANLIIQSKILKITLI